MSLFGNLTTDGLEESQDRIGGGYQPKETGIYTGVIKAAYADKSSGGAHNINLIVDIDGAEYRETIYITNKKGENYFLNKQDNSKKVPLPGFTTINDLCLVTSEKPLSEQSFEDKVIKLYDFDAKKEMPKSVPMMIDVIGQSVSLAIVKQIVNKRAKVNDEYVATAETREENFIDKVFHAETKVTVVEALAGKPAEFHDKWLERNKDQTRDKRTIKDGQAGSVSAGRPPVAGAATQAAPKKSLFAKPQ